MSDYETVQLEIKWTGFEKARDALAKMGGGEFVRGAFKEYAEALLKSGTDYASSITHFWTGMLSQSHEWEYDSHAMKGNIHINQRISHAFRVSAASGVVAGSTVKWPFIYGVYEHNRGYPHNFYERTMNEHVQQRAIPGLSYITQQVDILWR